MIHFHKWGRWTNHIGTFNSPLFPKLGSWTEQIQIRRCLKCGRTKVRRIA